VQLNIGHIDISSVMYEGQFPSRSLVSLRVIHRVLINRHYSHPITDDVGTTTNYSTPTSKVHNCFTSNGEINRISL